MQLEVSENKHLKKFVAVKKVIGFKEKALRQSGTVPNFQNTVGSRGLLLLEPRVRRRFGVVDDVEGAPRGVHVDHLRAEKAEAPMLGSF